MYIVLSVKEKMRKKTDSELGICVILYCILSEKDVGEEERERERKRHSLLFAHLSSG